MDKNMTINAYYLYSPEASQTSSVGMVPTFEIAMSQNAFGVGVNYQAK
jgi:hypothetical protein